MALEAETPIHLAGNNKPVTDERDLVPTRVVGEIPVELRGQFFRNGPNPRSGWSPHMFAGDGMIHTIALDDGEARFYRNRYVRTPLYERPGADRMALAFDPVTMQVDYQVTTANTHVISYAGRLLALEEGGFPYELTAGLETVGPFTFGGALETPMTAHPKVCPTTGELLFFGYQLRPPYLTAHRASATGELVSSEVVTVPKATMMHDFAITASSMVFFDSPIVFDRVSAATGGAPWRWDDGHGARFVVMPRGGCDADVRWFAVEPCHMSHAANAFDAEDTITVTGTRIPDDGGLPAMHRWDLHLDTGMVTEAALDDAASEYPRLPDSLVGLRNRYWYSASFVPEPEPDHHEIYRYDLDDGGVRVTHRLPPGHTCGEPVFVPRMGPYVSEEAGYLMTFAHDRQAGTSYLLILDAADLASAPVAEIHLPTRVPGGFHGSWVPAS